MRTLLMEHMTWPEIQQALKAGMKTVVIYTGAIEQHGPHLVEGTDTIRAYAEAEDLAKRLGNALVAPVIRPGVSDAHMHFPGSVTLRPETFRALLEDYVASYVRHGFDAFVFASTHGGNFETLKSAVADIRKQYPHIRFAFGYDMADVMRILSDMEQREGLTLGACGGHACDFETSAMLFVAPAMVQMDAAEAGHVGTLTPELVQELNQSGIHAATPNGILGDPTEANAERGERYFKALQDLQEAKVREALGYGKA